MAGTIAFDPVQRQSLRRNELNRRIGRNVELLADPGLVVGVDQHANEFLRQADHLRIGKRLARHLMAVVAPLGGEEQQQRFALLLGFRQALLTALAEMQPALGHGWPSGLDRNHLGAQPAAEGPARRLISQPASTLSSKQAQTRANFMIDVPVFRKAANGGKMVKPGALEKHLASPNLPVECPLLSSARPANFSRRNAGNAGRNERSPATAKARPAGSANPSRVAVCRRPR